LKTPARLQPLIDEGVIDSVVRQLMSGKEAMVFVVRCGGDVRCAKVYKEANQRSFRQAVDYTENRKTKNSRQARAMAKGTRFGARRRSAPGKRRGRLRSYRLAAAGVRVPKPYNFHERRAADGARNRRRGQRGAAPERRRFTPEEALELHHRLIGEVVRMLCAGVVHGDLSEFNVLLGADGPVIIDLPQAVDAAGNNHAPRMLVRDVDNLRRFFGRFAPGLLATDYGKEIWAWYQTGTLTPEVELTGTSNPTRRWPTWTASCSRSTTRGWRRRRGSRACRSATSAAAPRSAGARTRRSGAARSSAARRPRSFSGST
jgi:RIO kinase 1